MCGHSSLFEVGFAQTLPGVALFVMLDDRLGNLALL
jgi:hypothetical protein